MIPMSVCFMGNILELMLTSLLHLSWRAQSTPGLLSPSIPTNPELAVASLDKD